jgi:hypothetical protein
MSADAAPPPVPPAAALSVCVDLEPTWDSSLTYDLIEGAESRSPRGFFVGRESLVGPLVNAISEPSQRGTYLISGYRGVGKTSLIIHAMRKAGTKLRAVGWSIFPMVLNVSEVSASLDAADDTDVAALRIDARKLLTALLRSLRNRLAGTGDERLRTLADKVEGTYRKAQATTFTQTQVQKIDTLERTDTKRERSLRVANGMKLAAAVFLGATALTEFAAWLGTALNALHVVAVAFAALAVVTYGSSRIFTRSESTQETDTAQFVYDNSLHQLESELKDILAELHKCRQRTVIVLEELDKIDDQQGQQLESVIRYFKNLFTQAPALFFFLTDKDYYDTVAEKIDAARLQRSYAIEHTFFTHRLFVTRSGLDECLQYLSKIIVGADAHAGIDAIGRSKGDRLRTLDTMTPLEQCLRVLLFRSQDHFFDLKNALAQFVQIEGEGAKLRFDDSVLARSDLGQAAFHFLIEQKILAYYFGGGRDYANEALRSSLFAVFDTVGSDELRPTATVYPADGTRGERLQLSERRRIQEAVDSLLGDLQRGGSIEMHAGAEPGFTWSDKDPALVFAPTARLAPHEQALVDTLSRIAGTTKMWGESRLLRGLLAEPQAAIDLSEKLAGQARSTQHALMAMPVEEAESIGIAAERNVSSLMRGLIAKHVSALRDSFGYELQALSGTEQPNLFALSLLSDDPAAAVFVHYEGFRTGKHELEALVASSAERIAVVQVVFDGSAPAYADHGSLALGEVAGRTGARSFLATRVRLDEDLSNAGPRARWGQATADELLFSSLWVLGPDGGYSAAPEDSDDHERFTLVTRQGDAVTGDLRELLNTWWVDGEATLVWLPDLGPRRNTVLRTLRRTHRTAFITEFSRLSTDARPGDAEALTRQVKTGRVLVAPDGLYPDSLPSLAASTLSASGRCLAALHLTPEPPPLDPVRGSFSFLHLADPTGDRLLLAHLLSRSHQSYAASLLEGEAEAGNTKAIADLAVLFVDSKRETSREWQQKVLRAGSPQEQNALGDRLRPVDPTGAIALYRAAADAGHQSAAASLTAMQSDGYTVS